MTHLYSNLAAIFKDVSSSRQLIWPFSSLGPHRPSGDNISGVLCAKNKHTPPGKMKKQGIYHMRLAATLRLTIWCTVWLSYLKPEEVGKLCFLSDRRKWNREQQDLQFVPAETRNPLFLLRVAKFLCCVLTSVGDTNSTGVGKQHTLLFLFLFIICRNSNKILHHVVAATPRD